MKVVRNKSTGRIVYRQQPEFEPGIGILCAINLGMGTKEELEEIEVTQKEWNEEIKLREKEEPLNLQQQVDELNERITKLEEKAK